MKAGVEPRGHLWDRCLFQCRQQLIHGVPGYATRQSPAKTAGFHSHLSRDQEESARTRDYVGLDPDLDPYPAFNLADLRHHRGDPEPMPLLVPARGFMRFNLSKALPRCPVSDSRPDILIHCEFEHCSLSHQRGPPNRVRHFDRRRPASTPTTRELLGDAPLHRRQDGVIRRAGRSP